MVRQENRLFLNFGMPGLIAEPPGTPMEPAAWRMHQQPVSESRQRAKFSVCHSATAFGDH
jgi:hypothetical protein